MYQNNTSVHSNKYNGKKSYNNSFYTNPDNGSANSNYSLINTERYTNTQGYNNTFANNIPKGYNDNNLFRNNVPSNEKSELFGGRYEFQNSHNNNFNEVFEKNKKQLDFRDTKNKGGLVHNNIKDNVLGEKITEYKVHIDSKDRNLEFHLDPYDFTVDLTASQTKTTTGLKSPYIPREFRNVKYVNVETIILPKYSSILFADPLYIIDPSSYLIDDRFIALEIPELNDEVLSTDGRRKPFSLITPDTTPGSIYYRGEPLHGTKVYKTSKLGNISKLTIQLYDSFGNKLILNNKFTLDEAKINSTTELRHPLNKRFQIYITLVIGVVECELDKYVDYAR